MSEIKKLKQTNYSDFYQPKNIGALSDAESKAMRSGKDSQYNSP